ncbi:MAG TPA: DUF6308 family protein [Dehalococcoidia bacterium]|nr:DUF6308 family protein [Dehalococcoidia bacterium]
MTRATVILPLPIIRYDKIVSKFCDHDPSYSTYDSQPVSQDNILRAHEIRLSHKMGARFPNTYIKVLLSSSNNISKALSQISPSLSILDSSRQIPWQALEDLFKACVIPGMREANITKILHKKRPQLIPILDSVVVKKYLEPLLMTSPNMKLESKIVLHIKQLKRDAENNRVILINLAKRFNLTPIRILDILIWTYFETPSWLDNGKSSRNSKSTLDHPCKDIIKTPRQKHGGVALENVKNKLAKKITNPEEKCLFFKAKGFHDWGPYIAAVVLNGRGITEFERKDLIEVLRELIPKYYNNAKEGNTLPADLCWNPPISSAKVKFPCLDVVNKSRPFKYKFIGFKEAIKRKFGNIALRRMLADC